MTNGERADGSSAVAPDVCADPASPPSTSLARLREAVEVIENGDESWQTVGDLIDAAKAVLGE